MAIKPIPNQTVPVVDEQGRMTPVWYEFFKTLEAPFTLRTHTHDGVTVGGGVSGPPVPGT